MIYVNTASVLPEVISDLTAAMGDDPHVMAILLTCSTVTARQRLAQREIGTAPTRHIERSDLMARKLEKRAPAWVHRVATDGQAVADIAAEIIGLAGWAAAH